MTIKTPAQLYRQLRLIRRVEERLAEVYPTDKIQSPMHLSIGQEAVSVGICAAMLPGDAAFGTYRAHALYLALGGDLDAFVAEMMGKATGATGGWGGSMHLVAPEVGLMGTSAVVGTTIPWAVGWAEAQKFLKTGKVAVSFFGDGATEEGVFYESLNLAALWKSPVLFVCEDNGLAIHTPVWARQATSIADRAAGFGLQVQSDRHWNSRDAEQVAHHAEKLLVDVRDGYGPALLVCRTHRWREHVGPGEDFDRGYRTRESVDWVDPVELAAERIAVEHREAIDAGIEVAISAAFSRAELAPLPAVPEGWNR